MDHSSLITHHSSLVLPLTVVVLTRDEERHIVACLEAARLLRPAALLVLDSGSADATPALAEAAGARVVVRPFDGYASQVFWNQGGTFTPGQVWTPLVNGGRMLAIADFDGDRLPDLLQSRTDVPVVHRGVGGAPPSFALAWTGTVQVPFEPCAVTIADVTAVMGR